MRKAVVVGWEGRLGSVRLSVSGYLWLLEVTHLGWQPRGLERDSVEQILIQDRSQWKEDLHRITKETPTNKEKVVVVTSLGGYELGCRIQN